jgi:hypothetical protein
MTPFIRPEYQTIFSSPLLSIKGLRTILKDKGSKIILMNLMNGISKMMIIAIPSALHCP